MVPSVVVRSASCELRALSLVVFSTQSRGLATYGWPLRWVSPHSILCPPYACLMSYCTVHILQFICHVAQLVSRSTTFMSRSITGSTIFDHCVSLGGVRSGVSSLRCTCCTLWSAWISLEFLSGSLWALRVCTYTHTPSFQCNNVFCSMSILISILHHLFPLTLFQRFFWEGLSAICRLVLVW
jgi:hypothetical protein